MAGKRKVKAKTGGGVTVRCEQERLRGGPREWMADIAPGSVQAEVLREIAVLVAGMDKTWIERLRPRVAESTRPARFDVTVRRLDVEGDAGEATELMALVERPDGVVEALHMPHGVGVDRIPEVGERLDFETANGGFAFFEVVDVTPVQCLSPGVTEFLLERLAETNGLHVAVGSGAVCMGAVVGAHPDAAIPHLQVLPWPVEGVTDDTFDTFLEAVEARMQDVPTRARKARSGRRKRGGD